MGLHSSSRTSRLCSTKPPWPMSQNSCSNAAGSSGSVGQTLHPNSSASHTVQYSVCCLSLSAQMPTSTTHPAFTKIPQVSSMQDLRQALCHLSATWHPQACMRGKQLDSPKQLMPANKMLAAAPCSSLVGSCCSIAVKSSSAPAITGGGRLKLGGVVEPNGTFQVSAGRTPLVPAVCVTLLLRKFDLSCATARLAQYSLDSMPDARKHGCISG